MQTSGQSTSAGGIGKTTAEMKQQATFAGWDFVTIWGIAEGASIPGLRSSPPPFRVDGQYNRPRQRDSSIPASTDGTYAPGTVVTLTATPSDREWMYVIRWVGAQAETTLARQQRHHGRRLHRTPSRRYSNQTGFGINSLADLAKIGNDPAYPLAGVLYLLTTDIDASATAGVERR